MIASRSALSVSVLLLLLFATLVSASELRSPTCGDLAKWSGTVDPKDRWEPFAENPSLWLPGTMSTPEFEALFAKPALDWTQADVLSARTIWNGCIQQAKKTRNQEQRNLLQNARRYLTTNLRNVVRYQERREEKVARDQQHVARQERRQAERVDARAVKPRTSTPAAVSAPGLKAGVDQLIAEPPSTEGLIALGSLSSLNTDDADGMRKLEREFGYMSTPAAKAAYRIIRELRIRGTSGYEAELPRINARLGQVKPIVLDELRAEFSQNPADLKQRQALAQRYEGLMKQLKAALPEEEYLALADETRKERRGVVDRAVADAKGQIDQVPAGEKSIARIDRIVSETAKRGLDNKQRRDLVNHARLRQRMLADEILNDVVENELPALPETLAGVQALNAITTRMLQGIVQKADRDVIQQFVDASGTRLADIGRKALAEYAETLARLPENESGLAQAEQELADKVGWIDMEERVRSDYVAAAKARRDEIAAVVGKERAQQRAVKERERKRLISAGGDPRLVGSEWIDENKTMKLDFRDQETVFVNVVGLKFAGTYKISRDDVVVQGPHGQLVFTFRGDTLAGNGAVFRKSNN